ncbi:unnamed protein product [Cuscuta epithymum]|uniref:Retrotransposon gag domain-containing protein n=1 Tax=Cuscuta epithymum TaxID=186058 RepID=A0AAV0CVL0_9ASTE|nr:unnamed protein product [Cuscuta epithymum]
MEDQIQALTQSQLQFQQDIQQQFQQLFGVVVDLQKKLDKETSAISMTFNYHKEKGGNHARTLGYTPKLKFPHFDGNNSSMWLGKCKGYFTLCQTPEEQQVDIAALNMSGKGEIWVTSYLVDRIGVDWQEFEADLYARFKDDSEKDVVERFYRCQQKSSIDAYIDEFEELKSIIKRTHPFPEKYFLDCFIGGLKASLKSFVKVLKPSTMAEAIEFARSQEETLSATYKSISTFQKNIPNLVSTTHKPFPSKAALTNDQNSIEGSSRTYIPASLRAEKLAKGLRYYCDQPYDRNHKCQFKKTQLFTVEVQGWEDEEKT